jgi:phosphoribosylformylglycinamidine cyclo-ligase
MAIVGGETAILPDIIRDCGKTNIKNSFDLVGMVLGIVDRSKLILGNKIRTGDIILGVESSGLHSNGYTLARKVLLTKYSVDDKAKHIVHTVGEELLIPTRLYIRPVMEILKQRKISVHGLAHITGGSFSKLTRLNRNVRYNLDNLPVAEGIFKLIQNEGQIAAKEMYKTFNMGIGLCMVIPKASCDRIISVFEKYNMKCRRVGTVDRKGDGKVIAKINNKNEILSE